MPKNDDGEFELVLGNRQLIWVFAIVVVMLGAFFSMGYIVGRNSSATAPELARSEKSKPDKEADSSDSSSAEPSDQSSTPAASDSTTSTPPEITKPAQSQPPVPAPARPEPVRQEVKPKPSPLPAPAAPPVHAAAAPPVHAAAAPPVHAAAAGEPASGQYWQVVATARPDAEIVAEALGKKGFHATLAPAPKDGVFRVLVGPLPDAATQAQTRTSLEAAGFKNPIMRKY